MVCAGEAGKEPCNGDGSLGGDDGGPLSTVVGAQHVLVGPFMAGLCILNVSIYVRFTPQPIDPSRNQFERRIEEGVIKVLKIVWS